jgi:hypothetical protein
MSVGVESVNWKTGKGKRDKKEMNTRRKVRARDAYLSKTGINFMDRIERWTERDQKAMLNVK